MPGLTYIQGGAVGAGLAEPDVSYTLGSAVEGDIVFVATSNFFAVSQVFDSWGTTYTPLESATNGQTVGTIYKGIVFSGGDTTVTVQFTGSSTGSIAVAEFRYVGTLTSNGGSSNYGLNVTSLATGTISLTGNDLVFAMLSTTTTPSGTPAGYTVGPAFGPTGPTYGVATAYLLGGSGSTDPTWTAANGNLVVAAYAFSLDYQPATLPVPYVSMCGQALVLGATANTTSSSSIGTVSVASGSTALTTTNPQAGVIGWPITIADDSSAGNYTIIAGSGRNFTIAPAYGGASGAVGAVATIIQDYPAAPITAINSAPTVSVQFANVGSVEEIEIGGTEFWCPDTGGLPIAFWQLLCGGTEQAIIQDPGSNYSTSPTASATGVGGGTPPTFGAPVVSGGVTSFASVSGTYSTAPGVIIGPPPQITVSGTFTPGSVNVTGITSTVGLYPGMTALDTGTNNPNVIASIVNSTALTLALPATIAGSQSIAVFGKQAMATAVLSGTSLIGLNVFVPGTGYAQGSPPPVSFSSGDGAATAVVSRVIAYVPVATPGSKNTGPVPITISDSDGSGAVVVALMRGVEPNDTVSYSAADSWYAIAAGSAPPSSFSGSTVANYSGQLEPGFGGFLGFDRPSNQRLLKVGYNVPGPQNASYYPTFFASANWWKRAANFAGTIAYGIDNRPLTINGTAGSPSWFAVSAATGVNGVDGNSYPIEMGTWTLQVDDTDQLSPMNFSATSENGAATITQTFTEGVSTTGVTGFTGLSGGDGYTSAPSVTITGDGAGATAFAIVCNGAVIAVYGIAVGQDYTHASVAFSGGGGTGASVTASIGNVLSGRLYQWAVERNSTAGDISLRINAWKTTGDTYPYTATYEVLSDPATTAAALPGLPNRANSNSIGASTAAGLTTESGKSAYVLRHMDSTLGADGWNNLVDGEDLKRPDAWTYYYNYNFAGSGSSAPTRSRQINITAIRTYSISSTGLAWCTVDSGGSGYGPGTIGTVTDTGGGTGGTVSLVIADGVITGAYVQVTGVNYVTPIITLSDTGGGTGASITVTVGYPPDWGVTWSSPNIYYPGTYAGVTLAPTPGWIGYGSGSLGGPYYRSPGNVSYLSETGQTQPSPYFVAELVASEPHNFKYGQQILYDGSGTGTFSQSNGLGAVTSGQSFPGGFTLGLYPTGPTTLALLFESNANPTLNSGPGLPGGINTIAGTFDVDWNLDAYVPDSTSSDVIPFEVAAQMTASLPDCNYWANVNHAMTDEGAATQAVLIRDNGAVGRLVPLEISNEVWSSEIPNFYFSVSAQLGMWGDDPISAYVIRASAIHDIFEATFNAEDIHGNTNRGGEIFRLMGSQGSPDAGVTNTVINTANANTIKVNGVNISEYVNVPTDGSIVYLAALLATHWPDSPAYLATNPVSRALYCDFLRHYVMYNISNTSNAGLAGYINHQTALNRYDVTIDGMLQPIPILCIYEGSWAQIIPVGIEPSYVDPAGNLLYNQLVHDIYYAPHMYGAEDALYWSAQQYGLTFFQIFNLGGQFATQQNIVWSHTTWSGQPTGKGDGSTASNGVAITNVFWADTQAAHHDINASVLNAAWQRAANIANAPNVAPTTATLSGPTTSTESYPSTNFTVTLNEPAQSGGVSCVITSTNGSDTITSTPLVISQGSSTGTFTVTASSVGSRLIAIASTTPSLTISGSPLVLTAGYPAPTRAALYGPTKSTVDVASMSFTVTLNEPAQSGGVSCVITDSVGGDTITTTPVVIAQNSTIGTFTITASATGPRTITLASTTPSLTISGSPITMVGYNRNNRNNRRFFGGLFRQRPGISS